MSDNDITDSNTPIFNRLAAERGYHRLVEDNKHKSPFERMIPVRPVTAEEPQKPVLTLHTSKLGITSKEALANAQAGAERLRTAGMAAGMWMARPVPTVTAPREVFVMEVVHPEEAEEKYGSFAAFLEEFAKDFQKNFPNVENAAISTTQNLDGTVTARASGTRNREWGDADAEAFQKACRQMEESYADPSWLPESKLPEMFDIETTTGFEEHVLRDLREKPKNIDILRRKGGIRLDRKPVEDNPAPDMEAFSNFNAYEFVKDATEQFTQEHPYAVVTGLEPKGNPDGTVSMVIHAVEPVIGKEHVPDLAGQQLELYRQAAQYSQAHRSIPKPLRISDEEIPDKE